MIAFVHVSWLDPDKIRRTTIVGSRKMLVYDDTALQEKIRIYDKGVDVQRYYDTFGDFQFSYRYGDIQIPRIEEAEPLKSRVRTLRRLHPRPASAPRTDGLSGARVVSVLHAANLSLKNGGSKIPIENAGVKHMSGDIQMPRFACVADDVRLGARVRLSPFVNLYGCEIGDETRLGAFVEIQSDATIGRRCKISSHTFICEGVTIEDEVFVGHGVIFINDRYPRATTADGAPQTESRLADGGHGGAARRLDRKRRGRSCAASTIGARRDGRRRRGGDA